MLPDVHDRKIPPFLSGSDGFTTSAVALSHPRLHMQLLICQRLWPHQ